MTGTPTLIEVVKWPSVHQMCRVLGISLNRCPGWVESLVRDVAAKYSFPPKIVSSTLEEKPFW